MKFCQHLNVCKKLTILGYSNCYPRCLSSSSSNSSSKSVKDNYYDVLGIGKSSSRKEIRQAFIDKSKEYHPDSVSRSDLSSEQLKSKFQEINEAYQVLNDPTERQVYDESIKYPKPGYSNNNNWRQYGYGNFSDYQQYRSHQEFMRQQGHYWANYNRKINREEFEDLTWKSFFRYKMGQPMTVANFLLFIFVFGLGIEVIHSIYVFRYIAHAKQQRVMYGPSWFESKKEWDNEKDDEILDRLVLMSKNDDKGSTTEKSPKKQRSDSNLPDV